jgi:hypothetical protein
MQNTHGVKSSEKQIWISTSLISLMLSGCLKTLSAWILTPSVTASERRQQSFAYVFDLLMVLTVVYLPGVIPHIISFRPAKRCEREDYLDWLENDCDDA